jgi:hypothetical protein
VLSDWDREIRLVAAVIAGNGGKPIETIATAKPGDKKQQFAFHSFGAVFTNVHVDADLPITLDKCCRKQRSDVLLLEKPRGCVHIADSAVFFVLAAYPAACQNRRFLLSDSRP